MYYICIIHALLYYCNIYKFEIINTYRKLRKFSYYLQGNHNENTLTTILIN